MRKKQSKKVIDPFAQILLYANKKGASIFFNDSETNQLIDTPYSWEPKNKVLDINTDYLIGIDRKKTLQLIRDTFEINGFIFEKEKKDVIKNYSDYFSKSPDKKLLDFFNEIIPEDDYYALKMSLFLRHQSKHHKNIRHLKEDITEKYGRRGANIANLTSVDFFEEELMGFYNQVTRAQFDSFYEAIVGERAKFLFVSGLHNFKKLTSEFIETYNKAKKHHLKIFKIYAKGESNVALTTEFVSKLDLEDQDSFELEIPFESFIIKKENEDIDVPTISFIVQIL